ncbi:sorting nexin-24 isoform X4 [Tympanuchus pallidicinctus]|uniref:sorting nexin-24 isoform X4 n=1 Tax=Tympanuchus pallidicinctus TaxID=109042 RepID=UPI002286EFC2|nr:sorting nexin-24 isoform X4 [Tympanuchus pallidicinctus]
MEVYIPSFRYEESELERGYTVFKIEVLMSGRKHFVEKRYSEFHALHKKLKKCIRTPEIPSKHVRNWVPKVLEQRRQGLELYLQGLEHQSYEELLRELGLFSLEKKKRMRADLIALCNSPERRLQQGGCQSLFSSDK